MRTCYHYNFKLAILISLLLIFWGCEKIIEDFDFLSSDPKLVVNAPFITDSLMIIHVSRTIDIMDNDEFVFIDNAVAELFSDNVMLSSATYIDSGFYSFNLVPIPGQKYSIRVSSPGYPATESDIVMPLAPEIVSVEYIGWDPLLGLRFNVTISDPVETRDSYGISINTVAGWFEYDTNGIVVDTVIERSYLSYLTSSDVNVAGGIFDYYLSTSEWEDYFSGTTLLVEDNLVNGRVFTVEITTQDINFGIQAGIPISFSLESYSESYIKYLYSLELYKRSNGNPIAEKVSLYTNITGGLGVAYGKTSSEKSITLTIDDISDPYK